MFLKPGETNGIFTTSIPTSTGEFLPSTDSRHLVLETPNPHFDEASTKTRRIYPGPSQSGFDKKTISIFYLNKSLHIGGVQFGSCC